MKLTLQECVDILRVEIDGFPWTDRAAYADWLAQTYYYVSHSTRLLASAAARFGLDAAGNALHNRFAAHMSEEKKHELLALHDIKHLGYSLDRLPERPAARMFYEPQYFKIEHESPMALFGYILPLEAAGPLLGRGVMANVTQAFGSSAATFLKVHVNEDVDHLEKAFQMLESASSADRSFIERNMRQTTFAYRTMLQDIRHDGNVRAAAE
ncbi:MAG TPA: iron-containing redox enzyme family protein [Polyangiaceae bacterium]